MGWIYYIIQMLFDSTNEEHWVIHNKFTEKDQLKSFRCFFYLRNKKGAYSAPKSISYSALPAEPKKSVIMSLTKAVIASAPGFNSLRGS